MWNTGIQGVTNQRCRNPTPPSWQTSGISSSEERPPQASFAFALTSSLRSANPSSATTLSRSHLRVWCKPKLRVGPHCSSWIIMASRHSLPRALSYTWKRVSLRWGTFSAFKRVSVQKTGIRLRKYLFLPTDVIHPAIPVAI